jgi:lipoate-protein ligase A
MTSVFRVIDTGLRSGRENIAFDQGMIDARNAGDIPDSIRFIRFRPSALLGRHQALSQEIKVDHCRARGVDIARRITGGGAIYFDEGQLGWALVCARTSLGALDLAGITRKVCEAAAAGLSTLGVNARYRPRNDIEIDGRKVSGTGGFFDGDALIYQGTVLIDLNPQDMLAALNVPQAKLAKRALDDPAARVITLKEALGRTPDIDEVRAALLAGFAERLGIAARLDSPSEREEALARRLYADEIGTDEFVASIDDPTRNGEVHAGEHTGPGGTITAYVRLEGAAGDRVREVLFCGDFFVAPPRIVFDLESSLRGVALPDIDARIRTFFGERGQAGMLSVTPDDFLAALKSATSHQERSG